MSAERLTLLLSLRARVAVAVQLLATYHDELHRLHEDEMIPISVMLDRKAAAGMQDALGDLDTLIKAVAIDIAGKAKVEG